MKNKLLSLAGLMLCSSMVMAAPTHFIGADTYQINSGEGGTGLTYMYDFGNTYGVVATYNLAYIEGIKDGNTSSDWNSYESFSLGVNKELSKINDNLKLSATVGLEFIPTEKKLTTETDALNTYLQLNLDMPFGFGDSQNWLARFAMGTTGKGQTADLLQGDPDLGHGFVTKFSLYYGF